MRGYPTLSLLIGACGVAFACNAVLGLEDVALVSGIGGAGGDGGSDDVATGGESGAGGDGGSGDLTTGGEGGAATGGEGGVATGGDGGVAGGTAGGAGGSSGSGHQAGASGEGGAPPGGPVCGNGVLEGDELCDDGNPDADDGCESCAEPPGWTCSGEPSMCTNIDDCAADPCEHGGVCTDGVDEYTCDCTGTGYSGTTCQTFVGGPSCSGMTGTECQGGSCCESRVVTGGKFPQGYPTSFDATVSDFRLDRYEVTVGRFRRFVAAYDEWRAGNNPMSDAGENPNVSGSGWSTMWNGSLPASASVLEANVACGIEHSWVDGSGDDTLPMNCISWYESFAFCIWDGGWLPTESEWNYAAVGGANDYDYPWGNQPPDTTRAVYGCLASGSADCAFEDILPVGSKPAGDGQYGQRDLAGSMWEWVLDWHAQYPSSAPANFAEVDTGSNRVNRGGAWNVDANGITGDNRGQNNPTGYTVAIGARCARAL